MIRLSPFSLFFLRGVLVYYTLGLYEAHQSSYKMCCGGVRRCVLVTNFEHTHAIRNVTADLVMNNRPNYDVAVQLYRYSLSWKILSDPTLIIPL